MMTIENLKIEKQVYQGWGLGFSQGRAIFVDQAIDGDVLDAQIVKDHKAHAFAKINHLVQASPYRTEAVCPYTNCGGCHWLFMDYQRQIYWKKAFVREALDHIYETVPEIVFRAAPSPLEYRSRITLRLHIRRGGKAVFGFFEQQSYKLIPISACAISMSAINAFLTKLNECSFRAWEEKKFRLEIQVYPSRGVGERDKISLVVTPAQQNTGRISEFLHILEQIDDVISVQKAGDTSQQDFFHFGTFGGVEFFNSPGQFQQVNWDLNNVLRSDLEAQLKELAPIKESPQILDLFGGSGNLSLHLAKLGYPVTLVEQSKVSIACARYNIKKNNLKNISLHKGDSGAFLEELMAKQEAFPWDTVVMDPPRAGALSVSRDLLKLKPNLIFYISCDLATLRRDLKTLAEGHYVPQHVFAYDFFPGTFHVETMVILKRSSMEEKSL